MGISQNAEDKLDAKKTHQVRDKAGIKEQNCLLVTPRDENWLSTIIGRKTSESDT